MKLVIIFELNGISPTLARSFQCHVNEDNHNFVAHGFLDQIFKIDLYLYKLIFTKITNNKQYFRFFNLYYLFRKDDRILCKKFFFFWSKCKKKVHTVLSMQGTTYIKYVGVLIVLCRNWHISLPITVPSRK